MIRGVADGDVIVVSNGWCCGRMGRGGIKRCTKFPFEEGTSVCVEVGCVFEGGEMMNPIDDGVGHGKLGEVVAVNALAGVNTHKVVTALLIRGTEANGTDAAFFVGIVRPGIDFVVSAKGGLERGSIHFTMAEDNTSGAKSLGDAVGLWEVVKARYNHGETFVHHEFRNLFERERDPEAASALLDCPDATLNAWDVLPSTAYFKVCAEFGFKFGEFIVSVNGWNLEAS